MVFQSVFANGKAVCIIIFLLAVLLASISVVMFKLDRVVLGVPVVFNNGTGRKIDLLTIRYCDSTAQYKKISQGNTVIIRIKPDRDSSLAIHDEFEDGGVVNAESLGYVTNSDMGKHVITIDQNCNVFYRLEE